MEEQEEAKRAILEAKKRRNLFIRIIRLKGLSLERLGAKDI